MQASQAIDVEIDETSVAEIEDAKGVDQKLLLFCKTCNGRIATTDYNLTKVAQVRGVDVVNVNDLANLLKVVVLPGEQMQVRIVKPGEEADQGIGYLDDGTMIVVENARNKIGRDRISVTSRYNLGRQDDLRAIRVLCLQEANGNYRRAQTADLPPAPAPHRAAVPHFGGSQGRPSEAGP
jgi:uncharacterized protein YacL